MARFTLTAGQFRKRKPLPRHAVQAAAVVLGLLAGTPRAGAVDAGPVDPAPAAPASLKAASKFSGALEIRANDALNAGKYAEALPILQKLAADLRADPNRASNKLGLIEEQIRVCQKNLPPGVAAVASASGNAGLTPNGVPVPVAAPADAQASAGDRPVASPNPEERKPFAEPKDGQVVAVAIKELGNFDYDATKGGNIPDDVKRLTGHTLRTHGFMLPLDQADNVTEFALVPSLFGCCQFGQPPQVQHTIVVRTPKGKAVSYFPDEIVVEGKLKVEEKKDDGYIVSVFEMDAISVKPAPK